MPTIPEQSSGPFYLPVKAPVVPRKAPGEGREAYMHNTRPRLTVGLMDGGWPRLEAPRSGSCPTCWRERGGQAAGFLHRCPAGPLALEGGSS